MPKDLPPDCICYDYWRRLTDGYMDRINHRLVMADRAKVGREASQTVVVDGGYKKRFAESVQALAGAQVAGVSCQWSAERR